MTVNFNDFENIPLGVHTVTVEIRQKTAAGVLSDVAYTEEFNIHVLSCLNEVLEYDMDDDFSRAFH